MDKMMRRIVPSILVLLQLAQGLAIPHSHAGTGVEESSVHSQRLHFHFGVASHDHGHGHPHHHDHDDGRRPSEEPASDQQLPFSEHDSDAVYLSDEAASDRTSSRLNPEPWHQLFFSVSTVIARLSTPPA